MLQNGSRTHSIFFRERCPARLKWRRYSYFVASSRRRAIYPVDLLTRHLSFLLQPYAFHENFHCSIHSPRSSRLGCHFANLARSGRHFGNFRNDALRVHEGIVRSKARIYSRRYFKTCPEASRSACSFGAHKITTKLET